MLNILQEDEAASQIRWMPFLIVSLIGIVLIIIGAYLVGTSISIRISSSFSFGLATLISGIILILIMAFLLSYSRKNKE